MHFPKFSWQICLLILILSAQSLFAIRYDDARFLVEKELWQKLEKHQSSLRDSALISPTDDKWLSLYQQYSEQQRDTLAILNCLEKATLAKRDLSSAIAWKGYADQWKQTHPGFELKAMQTRFSGLFTSQADIVIWQAVHTGLSEDSLLMAIQNLTTYNSIIEDMAKEKVDNISVERNDSLSFAMVKDFYTLFPHSKWAQAVYYFELAHFLAQKDYQHCLDLIMTKGQSSAAHAYLSTLYLLNPLLRKNLSPEFSSNSLIETAKEYLQSLPANQENLLVLYDQYDPAHWQNRIKLQTAKAQYYQLLQRLGCFGDEDSLQFILTKADSLWVLTDSLLKSIRFANNDSGEMAELAFWQGKLSSLLSDEAGVKIAAGYFITCLQAGAPRKKYDVEAYAYLIKLHKKLKIKSELMTWARSLAEYKGIIFKDITLAAGFQDNRESRIAIGDYNSDSFADILLNGNRLYKNNGDLTFKEQTDSLGWQKYNANGGLFADFNLDGKLDLMTISHAEDGNGERLLKNMGNRFVNVSDRAGDIDDKSPTEGAAWIDCFHDAYPEIYCANYEKWQVRDGYPDAFWNNEKGYFSDQAGKRGFLTPDYTHDFGQAGRGVAPADFDNDGDQEIYVCNYRLDRNFLWDKQDSTYIDIAPLVSLQGKLKKGYYGHSIGADWGDYDNDGDLDLFVANLAHPRYIEISDVSQLWRNDGMTCKVIAGDTIRYWQFTDVTRSAGITFDELHSDPNWLDADNDGYLDLFITSIYENDRSYLYHNNGDGTFSDVTWLAGARVYNGWGNAFADLNHDGKLDLVVGSGNGTKIFVNQTVTNYKSYIFKPVWQDGKVALISSWQAMKNIPNSPAYGSRIILTVKSPTGRQFDLIRELCSAKGTTSQNDQILHFGLGKNKLIGYKLFVSPPHVQQGLSCSKSNAQDKSCATSSYVQQDLSCSNLNAQDKSCATTSYVQQDLSCSKSNAQDKSCATPSYVQQDLSCSNPNPQDKSCATTSYVKLWLSCSPTGGNHAR